jgi:hypothetical protein
MTDVDQMTRRLCRSSHIVYRDGHDPIDAMSNADDPDTTVHETLGILGVDWNVDEDRSVYPAQRRQNVIYEPSALHVVRGHVKLDVDTGIRSHGVDTC